MSRKVLCFEGKRLDTKVKGILVKRNGDPTDLYYHIQECEECEKLRSENLKKTKMPTPITFSKEKPDVIDMLNKHIVKRLDPIRAMSIEETEIHVEKLRWEFNYSVRELERKTIHKRQTEPLVDSESVLERIKRKQPTKKSKKQGRKKKTPRERMKALGIYTDEQLTAMGVR